MYLYLTKRDRSFIWHTILRDRGFCAGLLSTCLSWNFVLMWSCTLNWVTKIMMQAISIVHVGRIWSTVCMFPTPSLHYIRKTTWNKKTLTSRLKTCCTVSSFGDLKKIIPTITFKLLLSWMLELSITRAAVLFSCFSCSQSFQYFIIQFSQTGQVLLELTKWSYSFLDEVTLLILLNHFQVSSSKFCNTTTCLDWTCSRPFSIWLQRSNSFK